MPTERNVGCGYSVIIADPLYELCVLKLSEPPSESIVPTLIYSDSQERYVEKLEKKLKKKEELYYNLLRSFEMQRLNFLKQSGLSFLVFPSATHSRLSHSIGTWTLGNYALQHVSVRSNGSEITLGRWMDMQGKEWRREEFLLALLLHDLGHLPFSHVLENCLGEDGKPIFPQHEEITLDYLSKGKYWKMLRKYQRGGGSALIFDENITYTVAQTIGKRSLQIIRQWLEEGEDSKNPFYPINLLVHGSFDLDRMDHYNRDSYFMGLKLANVNIRGILENLVIDMRDPHEKEMIVLEGGLSHIVQLLISKESLWDHALDSDEVRRYECMLGKAVEIAVREELDKNEVVFYTDDELVHKLLSCKEERVKMLVKAIFTRHLYRNYWRWNGCKMGREEVDQVLREFLKKEDMDETCILFFAPKNLGAKKTKRRDGHWLREVLIEKKDSEIKPLSELKPSFIRYLEEQDEMRRTTVRFYFKTKDIAEKRKKLEKEMNDRNKEWDTKNIV